MILSVSNLGCLGHLMISDGLASVSKVQFWLARKLCFWGKCA